MKKMIVGGLAAVAAALSIAAASPAQAHADSTDATIAAINAASQFTADVTNAGFYNQGGAASQLLVGIDACNRLDAGWTPAQVTNDLYVHSGLSAFGSGRFVGIAVRDLCPWHFGQDFFQSMPHGGSGSGTGTLA
jgi:cytolysin (calcineurin-like family phosphatase)